MRQLVKSKHLAMIEFGRACFEVDEATHRSLQNAENAAFFSFTSNYGWVVSGNFRSWYEFFLNNNYRDFSFYVLKEIA